MLSNAVTTIKSWYNSYFYLNITVVANYQLVQSLSVQFNDLYSLCEKYLGLQR